jgi:tubulin polyglutamylase TTLL9
LTNIIDVHLTNVAVQHKSNRYAADSRGTKWDLRDLKLFMITLHGNQLVDKLFSDIQDTILRALDTVKDRIPQDKRSFEL